jgi:hypothetical protein
MRSPASTSVRVSEPSSENVNSVSAPGHVPGHSGARIGAEIDRVFNAAGGQIQDGVIAARGREHEGVVAAAAAQDVVAAIAGDDVGVVVAGGVDVARAEQGDVVDIGA